MSTLDVVAEVLREVAPRALKARQIAALAGSRLPTASRTPETVVSRDLAIDVRDRGAASRFLRVDRGAFVLKEALPTAFYSDNDKYAAQWTRNLIAAGEIAAGVVDERSIRDLKPADVASYRQCHFFNGISVWPRAIREAGWPDDFNIWSGSCPCQGMSSAGKRQGFADERHLWPEWFRLIGACRPTLLVTEQVASKDGRAWLDLVLDDLEGIDYACQAYDLPACGFGAPHRRQRLFIVAYARERGREILGAPWLHDRGQPGDDAAGRGAVDGGHAGVVPDSSEHGRDEGRANSAGSAPGDDALVDRSRLALDGGVDDPGTVSDSAGARRGEPQDAGADRGDASPSTEAFDWRSAGGSEPQRGGDADGAGAVPDAERVVRDEGWIGGSHGRPEVEPDRHGEADGEPVGMGDAGLSRGRWDAGEVPRAEEAREGERIAAGGLADESGSSGADDVAAGDGVDGEDVAMVRGTVDAAGDGSGAGAAFRPGDRIRLDDPSWGGSVGGYWAVDVEWIYCRPEPGHQDGRWRPVESGTQPLVTRTASDLGRTRAARLRGYGNSIVRPVAVAFVEAVIEAFADAARSLDVAAPGDVDVAPVLDLVETREESAA